MNNITVVEPATLPFHMPDTVEAWHIRGALFWFYLKARTCYGPTPSDRSRFGKDRDPRLY